MTNGAFALPGTTMVRTEWKLWITTEILPKKEGST
jgi:hypothetical protein